MMTSELDLFIEAHLDLQVKISYPEHHDFLLRHKLNFCSNVLDIGTGNGSFLSCLAKDHPDINFLGIDKRKVLIESSKKYLSKNFAVSHVDMFSRRMSFDFSQFDGFLMRYFLLHVDNSEKILELLKNNSKRPCKFWIIDLDWSKFRCEPQHEAFDKLTHLVKDFCTKISVNSLGGQRVLPLLEKLNYENILVESIPFSTHSISIFDLAQYLKQEVICYSMMSGREENDPETAEIVRFIDQDVRSGKVDISYSMILIYSELNPEIE